MNYVVRLNLKTDCDDSNELINFCLYHEKQYLAIGWSYIYEQSTNSNEINNYEDFYNAVLKDAKNENKRINHALNVFWDTVENDLFWTRDLNGNYWICRAKGKAQKFYSYSMDIGAIIPIEAYKVGMRVPGQIKASFNRPRGGIAEAIYDENIFEYSKYTFNKFPSSYKYDYKRIEVSLLDNLPDFELEELVIAYIQLKKNYYVLSNSIANKSTTIKIECEFIGRNINNPKKAVVQVKGGHNTIIDAMEYESYSNDGYEIFLYAPNIINIDSINNCIQIHQDELISFYNEYKSILPESITEWENLF